MTVTEDDDGLLFCSADKCGEMWCDHIQKYMQDQKDRDGFWKRRAFFIDDHERKGWDGTLAFSLSLPIIPTHGLWAEVAIEKVDHWSPWHLWLKVPHPTDSKKDERFRIGITGPQEARKVWRLMVIDYFRAQIAFDQPKCQSKGHTVQAQANWASALILEENKTESLQYSLNMWTAWYHKLCWYCYQTRNKLVTGHTDFDDLVPNDPKARTRGGVSFADSAASGSYIVDADEPMDISQFIKPGSVVINPQTGQPIGVVTGRLKDGVVEVTTSGTLKI